MGGGVLFIEWVDGLRQEGFTRYGLRKHLSAMYGWRQYKMTADGEVMVHRGGWEKVGSWGVCEQ